ncbi:hypothetical protein [Methylosinus sp. Ce-a6]|uniref:hypothetical protein n=1 Tax=Methylosinus sp. Ce-a6 TaxID=2172005 RepID=UPI00135C4520|nr:hypothetical protein [Methylosinus sp. Ce-a6]
MIDELDSEFHGEPNSETSPKLSRRSVLTGLFALPIAALGAGPAEAQYIGFGPFRLHLGPNGGYGGGYRARRPRPVVRRHSGGGSRHASGRGRHGGGGGDNGGGAASSATGLGKADY